MIGMWDFRSGSNHHDEASNHISNTEDQQGIHTNNDHTSNSSNSSATDLLQETIKLKSKLIERWMNPKQFAKIVFDLDEHTFSSTNTSTSSSRTHTTIDHQHHQPISSSDGITYNQLYDGLSQFGLIDDIDVDKVFAFLDTKKTGWITKERLMEVMTSSGMDEKETSVGNDKEEQEEEDDGDNKIVYGIDLSTGTRILEETETFPTFPEPLLIGIISQNDLKVCFMCPLSIQFMYV